MQVNKVAEYLEIVNDLFFNHWNCMAGDIWFRGVGDENYNLIPKIQRFNHTERVENSIIEEFLIYYKTYSNEIIENPWEQYALMQHYNLPTRLLDWSKSPLIALYFAAISTKNTNPIVWCIDPFLLNKLNQNKETIFTPKLLNSDDNIDISLYLPQTLRNNKKNLAINPIAIELPFSNKRIAAQQGCFTIHGSKDTCISNYYNKIQGDGIKKIIISQKAKKQIIEELENMGFREDNIWQDLSSLSSRITKDHLK